MIAGTSLARSLYQPRFVFRAYRWADRLARRRWLTLILVGLAGFVASAAFSLVGIRPPKNICVRPVAQS